ncbi:MAG: histidine kinase [Spirosomataceae bacterium]
MKYCITFCWCFLVSWAKPCLAQDLPIEKYTSREGLVQNQVLCLHKDSRGYVWCGTWFGLSKFNGETFENYTKKEGLWDGPVFDINEDKNGNIWLKGSSIIARFDGKTFKKWRLAELSSEFIIGPNGAIQFWMKNQLMQVRGDTTLPVPLPNLPKGRLNMIAYHPTSQSYWLRVDNRAYQYKNGIARPLSLLGTEPNWMFLLHGQVHFVMQFSPTHHEYSYWDGGDMVRFLLCEGKHITVQHTVSFPYFFVYEQTLYYLPKGSKQVVNMGVNPPLAHSLSFMNQLETSPYYLPTEKGLWKVLSLNAFRYFSPAQVPYAWSVVEDFHRNMYFLNFEVGLQQYDGQHLKTLPAAPLALLIEQHKQTLRPADRERFSFKNNWYFRALRDQQGALWLPEASGVFRYDGQRWRFFRPSRMGSLAFCLTEDKKRGKIVAASEKYFYTIETHAPYRSDSLRGKTALFDGLVMCTTVSPIGDYWFCGLGIERYNPDTKQWTAYTAENGKLPVKGGAVLYTDWNGVLWFGAGSMLCRYNPASDTFEKVLEGEFSKQILLIEQIDTNHLLIGDLQGLYVWDVTQYNTNRKVVLKSFNHHNGFMGLEPGQLGTYRDSYGRIWITSGTVLSVLNPSKLDLQVHPLRTFITELNGERVGFEGGNASLSLPFGVNTVYVKAESIGEDKPFHSQFSYRLLGEKDDWSAWQESPFIALPYLSNGIHTLQVRSRTGTIQASQSNITSLMFRTSVYFWKSPTFYLYASAAGLILSLILIALWWRDHHRNKMLINNQKQLEERERQMRLLQTQTIQSQMNPHFTSNTISAIQRLILKQDAESANQNLIKMERLTRAYLEDSIFQEAKNIFVKEIPLSREVSLLKMYIELMQLQYEERFDYEIVIDTTLNLEHYRLPPFLIQPFVENAIVHGLLNRSEKGQLNIQFWSLPEETLVCKVEDNGIGIAAAQALQLTRIRTNSSVSTTLIQQRVKLLNQLGYQIQIDTQNAQNSSGTVVTIQINFV